MGTYQDNRFVKLDGAGDLAGLRLTAMSGREEVSRPFRYELSLVGVSGAALNGSINPDNVLGKPLTVTLCNPNGEGSDPRHFNGVITEFAHTGYGERYHEYAAVLRPAFWLLSHRSDSRVFQNKTTAQIFADVCRQAGGVDHRLSLSAQYQPWEQRVQYQESDFDFLSRLLEHDGIYYYFEHKQGQHIMVLVDDVAKLTPVGGYDKVPYQPAMGGLDDRDHLRTWTVSKTFRAAACTARDYNFETPASPPTGASQVARRSDASRYELFEYPAGANKPTRGETERIAKLRAQQLQSSQSIARSTGDAAGLAAGRVFTLTSHPNANVNKKYLVLATELALRSDSGQTGGTESGAEDFSISIEAVDAQEPYRPERLTPRPRIHGTQTAFVVGGQNDEILTDKYARAKVQFFWDRAGSVSCWVRVAQGWAGKNWGLQHLPREGQEVVVSFLEGDPDHPLIIGSVYNSEQMPPYALPDNKTRSGVKSRSSTQGTAENFNELRFEDKKGEEEIYLHAEKNLQVVVENNQTISIGATKKDAGDRSVTIHNDDTLSVGHDRKVTVKRNLDTTVTEKETRKVSKSRATTVEQNDELDVKKKYTLSAGDEITLKVGLAKIVMKKDGTVEISGKEVKLSGTMKAEIDSPQTAVSGTQVEVKGTKTAVQGSGMLDLASSGIASLKGSLTKIG